MMIFSLARNTMFPDYWKVLWTFWKKEIQSFRSQKADGNIIFTDYWQILVLNFLSCEIPSFLSQKVDDGKMIFTNYWKFLVLNFPGMGNTVFFWNEKLMERLYLLGIFGLSCSVNSLSTSASLIFSMRDKYSLVFEVLL